MEPPYRRPFTDSLAFALVAGALVFLISRSPRLGLATLIGLASHVVRDASGGTAPLLWPIQGDVTIPTWLYYASEVGLLVVAYVLWGRVA